MQQNIRLFGSIAKVEDQADGTIKVYGVASSGGRDTAGEIVMPDAMKNALPDYSRYPALREMHQPLAAGKVLEADVDGEGVTNIVAHVVDPLAVTKVKTGVYAGFSIGGKVTQRDASDRSIITGLRLVEISLVDSPCNPDAVLSMWKADTDMATTDDFKPANADVIARAKLLAKAAGTHPRFKEYLFEAAQELVSEHLLEKGEVLEPPPEVVEEPVAAAVEEPGKEAAAAVEAPAVETPVVEEPAAVEPKEAGAEGEQVTGADATDEQVADPANPEHEPKEAVDPAAAITAAVEKGNAAIADAAPAVEETADPFADLGKAADALRCISAESPLLAKSLWHVSRLADLLSSFASLQQCVKGEAECEGDSSAVPQEMADQLKAMGATLVTMAQEEVAELLSEPTCEIVYIGDYCEYAAGIVDLVKGDADLMAKAAERGPKADETDTTAATAAQEERDAEKAATADQIATLTAERDELAEKLAKAAPAVEETVGGLTGTIDTLKAEIVELRKRFDDEPLPPKTAGPAALGTPVSKGADSANADEPEADATPMTDEQFQKAWDALPDAERGQILLKVALSRPQPLLPR